MTARSPPRDRPASPAFFRQELDAALRSHAFGLGSYSVDSATPPFGVAGANARVQLLEGTEVEISITARGYTAQSISASHFLPSNVFNQTFESLDGLLPLLSPAYAAASSSELSRKLSALAGASTSDHEDDSDWMDVSAPPGSRGDPMVEQEWTRMSRRYTDAGYREGIIAGKESTLQQGFDTGFEIAVPNARRLGQLRGRAAGLLSLMLARSEPVDDLRDLIRDLGKVKREDVLPIDHEAEAHARDQHGGDAEWKGDSDEGVDGLEASVQSLGSTQRPAQSVREDALLAELESRLNAISSRIAG